MVPQLDGDVARAHRVDEPVELAARGARAVRHERGGHRSFAAPREHQPVPAVALGELVDPDGRTPLLAQSQVRVGEQHRQGAVAFGVAREHDEVRPYGILDAGARATAEEGQLCPEDARDPEGARRLREADRAVEAVVIGEGERLQAERRGGRHQLLGVRRAVEEAEARVRVQLGVPRHQS